MTMLCPGFRVRYMVVLPVYFRRKQISWRILRIPAKASTDSGGNANGIPGRRRTVLGAQRRWHFDCARSVRHRQVKLIRSEAEVAGPLAKKGVRGKDGTSCPRLGTQ